MRVFFFCSSIKMLSIGSRYGIPYLWPSNMHVVHRVKHQVFIMPSKRRVHHSHIEPRTGKSANFGFLREPKQWFWKISKIVQIPWVFWVWVILISRKSRPEFLSVKISDIFNSDWLSFLFFYILQPVFLFKCFNSCITWRWFINLHSMF